MPSSGSAARRGGSASASTASATAAVVKKVSSMSDIALHAVAKLSTVTKAVYRIQEEGLVETSTSPQDARVTLVKITAAGRRALERSQLATQHIVSRSFEGMTPGQLKRLNESLRVILDNLSPRHSEVSGAPLRRGGATEKA